MPPQVETHGNHKRHQGRNSQGCPGTEDQGYDRTHGHGCRRMKADQPAQIDDANDEKSNQVEEGQTDE